MHALHNHFCSLSLNQLRVVPLACRNAKNASFPSPSCTVGIKKVPIYRPYNGTGNSVPFPFNFRAVAVLVRFQTVPVLSHGQPVRSGERPVRRN